MEPPAPRVQDGAQPTGPAEGLRGWAPPLTLVIKELEKSMLVKNCQEMSQMYFVFRCLFFYYIFFSPPQLATQVAGACSLGEVIYTKEEKIKSTGRPSTG